jgi:hypothetical protein
MVRGIHHVSIHVRDRTPVDMGELETLYGRDPEGNVIEIQQTMAHCGFTLEKLP